MNKNECVKAIIETPDYVISIFWIFLSVIMLALIGVILVAGLKATCEFFEDRRRAYLRNKQEKIQLELLEKHKNER